MELPIPVNGISVLHKVFNFQIHVLNNNIFPQQVMAQKKDIRNKHKLRAELTYKFVAWGFVGFVVQFVAPVAFSVVGCQRSTFHTEV